MLSLLIHISLDRNDRNNLMYLLNTDEHPLNTVSHVISLKYTMLPLGHVQSFSQHTYVNVGDFCGHSFICEGVSWALPIHKWEQHLADYFERTVSHCIPNSNPMLVVTLQIQDKELPTGVYIGPVREGQHQFFKQAARTNLISIVVVVLPKFTSHVLLNGQPLVRWMAVDKENFQEPVDTNTLCQEPAG